MTRNFGFHEPPRVDPGCLMWVRVVASILVLAVIVLIFSIGKFHD